MDRARLTSMANQIARNFAAQGDEEAVAQTAQHIRDYWEPRMITALRENGGAALDAVAIAALGRLNSPVR